MRGGVRPAACLVVETGRSAAELLARSKQVMGLERLGDSVIHYRAVAAAEQNYQSDRTYPPFFSAMEVKEGWFDPRGGVERVSTQTTYPGGGSPAQVTLTDAKRAFALVNNQPRARSFACAHLLAQVIRRLERSNDADNLQPVSIDLRDRF